MRSSRLGLQLAAEKMVGVGCQGGLTTLPEDVGWSSRALGPSWDPLPPNLSFGTFLDPNLAPTS